MCLAFCFDTSMLVGALCFLLLLGAVCCTLLVLALVVFARWADARQKRLAAETSPAANAR